MRPYTTEERRQLAVIEKIAWGRSFRTAKDRGPMSSYEIQEWFRCREFHRISDELAAEAGIKQPRGVFRVNRKEQNEQDS